LHKKKLQKKTEENLSKRDKEILVPKNRNLELSEDDGEARNIVENIVENVENMVENSEALFQVETIVENATENSNARNNAESTENSEKNSENENREKLVQEQQQKKKRKPKKKIKELAEKSSGNGLERTLGSTLYKNILGRKNLDRQFGRISSVDFVAINKPERMAESESIFPEWYLLKMEKLREKEIKRTKNEELTKNEEFPRKREKAEKTNTKNVELKRKITRKRSTKEDIEIEPVKRGDMTIIGGKRRKLTSSKESSLNRKSLTSVLNIPIEEDVFPLLDKCMPQFWNQLSESLDAYATHACHTMIHPPDVELFLKRCRLINPTTSAQDLVRKHLPMEMVEQLIPIAQAYNRVTLVDK